MAKEKKPKQKKPKVTYIDDGRTIADMSAVGGARSKRPASPRADKKDAPRLLRGRHSTFREQADTFLSAMRMMFLPMLVVIAIITLAFLVLWFLL